MMIDFALDKRRREGEHPRQAIYNACVIRFRPIMITTLSDPVPDPVVWQCLYERWYQDNTQRCAIYHLLAQMVLTSWRPHFNFSYSRFASIKSGTSGSASCHN